MSVTGLLGDLLSMGHLSTIQYMYVGVLLECQALLAIMGWLQPLHTYSVFVQWKDIFVTDIWLSSER